MTADEMTPERREMLATKYGIHTGAGYGVQDSTPPLAVARAWAEQVERTVRAVHAACEAYNGEELAWLTWELPDELRRKIGQVRGRVREARRRNLLHYFDDRNKYDESNGWPAFDPDNPDHATVPVGTIVADPETVHVLRGGTEPLFDRRDHLGRFDRPGDVPAPNDGLPDYGHAYDVATFLKTAERTYTFGLCGLYLPEGCGTPGDGRRLRVIAVPVGQHIYALRVCSACLDAMAETWRQAHSDIHVGTPRRRRRRGA